MVQCRRIIIERAQEPRTTNTLRTRVPENARFQESRIFSIATILERMEEEESADGQQKRAIRRNETIGEGNSSSKEEREIERKREREKENIMRWKEGRGKEGSKVKVRAEGCERENRAGPLRPYSIIFLHHKCLYCYVCQWRGK